MSSSETAAKKDVQKLQRAIVDGLEDVKAQDIQVFDTEHLSSLFERVIVASGTSNRQTKALAASVVDAVREAGFVKPRIEGEENGEWIIVDCGAAVVHVMQPTIRTYYHLEEIWGDKPVRLKFGAVKPAEPEKAASKAPAKTSAKSKKPELGPSLRRSSAVKTAERDAKQAEAAKAPAKRAPAKRATAKTAAVKSAPAGKTAAAKVPAKLPLVKVGVKPASKPASKLPSKTAGKAPAKKAAPKKA